MTVVIFIQYLIVRMLSGLDPTQPAANDARRYNTYAHRCRCCRGGRYRQDQRNGPRSAGISVPSGAAFLGF